MNSKAPRSETLQWIITTVRLWPKDTAYKAMGKKKVFGAISNPAITLYIKKRNNKQSKNPSWPNE